MPAVFLALSSVKGFKEFQAFANAEYQKLSREEVEEYCGRAREASDPKNLALLPVDHPDRQAYIRKELALIAESVKRLGAV